MHIREWQEKVKETYHARDTKRGLAGNFMWFVEEVGELSEALRFGTREQIEGEFADCLAWLTTLANVAEVDLEQATAKYRDGCPACRAIPCTCKEGA